MRSGQKPKLRIIVSGLVGQYPLGGVAWDYFHYLLGLHQLGHEVYYHEDTWVWPFDPQKRYPVDYADYTVRFLGEFFQRYAPELAERWHYVLLHEKHYGMTAGAFDEVARSADIFLNVSGMNFFPDALGGKCLKVFVDTDPGYNQVMLQEKFRWSEQVDRWCAQVAAHDRHLTYAENLYAEDCTVPRGSFDWRPTRAVVTLPQWSAVRDRPAPAPGAAPFTTIMTWDYFRGPLIHKGVEYFSKVPEFERFGDLPNRTRHPIRLAVAGHKSPYEKLRESGWSVEDAQSLSLTPESYQQFIGDSFAEWSIAKNVYVAMKTGWFSCRTACYLAAGRPAVVQDTGWSRYVPSGRGVIAFSTMGECLAAMDELHAHPREHCEAAYAVAHEYLSPQAVLAPMIEAIYADSAASAPRPPSANAASTALPGGR